MREGNSKNTLAVCLAGVVASGCANTSVNDLFTPNRLPHSITWPGKPVERNEISIFTTGCQFRARDHGGAHSFIRWRQISEGMGMYVPVAAVRQFVLRKIVILGDGFHYTIVAVVVI